MVVVKYGQMTAYFYSLRPYFFLGQIKCLATGSTIWKLNQIIYSSRCCPCNQGCIKTLVCFFIALHMMDVRAKYLDPALVDQRKYPNVVKMQTLLMTSLMIQQRWWQFTRIGFKKISCPFLNIFQGRASRQLKKQC